MGKLFGIRSLSYKIFLLLLVPVLIAAAIVFFEFQNLRTIYKKVHLIEFIDDINVTILEIRRYEKNILLFEEDQNVRIFYQYFESLKKTIRKMEQEIVSDIGKIQYKSLQKNLDLYERDIHLLISTIKKEHRIITEIRPLGRGVEADAADKKSSLELRRWEKNYIIYKEQTAIEKVHAISNGLVKMQPALTGTLDRYLRFFDLLVKNDLVKNNCSSSIRLYAREIQSAISALSKKKREDINRIISQATLSFIASFLFLLGTTVYAWYIISKRILKTVNDISSAVKSMAKGDFTYIIDPSAPEEIVRFHKAYNCRVRKLEEAKVELELTLEKLEHTNKELVEKQEELVEARKMTAMRLLASEIAHEVSNPLSSLITTLGMHREELPADNPKKDELTFMLSEATRCQAILRELVDFARKEPLQLKETCPAKLIHEAVRYAGKQQNGKRINLVTSLQGLPERAVLDPVLMYQAFFNIITNAYQHSSGGDGIYIHGSMKDAVMMITVRDTGVGIADDVLPYIFDPFFSTRKDTGGNGLGLAITKKIIERHNGTVHVSSRLGAGTVFHITLPLRTE